MLKNKFSWQCKTTWIDTVLGPTDVKTRIFIRTGKIFWLAVLNFFRFLRQNCS